MKNKSRDLRNFRDRIWEGQCWAGMGMIKGGIEEEMGC